MQERKRSGAAAILFRQPPAPSSLRETGWRLNTAKAGGGDKGGTIQPHNITEGFNEIGDGVGGGGINCKISR